MKRIDGKFSIAGEMIVKTTSGEAIPEDEPLFLLRARDRLALPLLRVYEQLSLVDGCNTYHFAALLKTIAEFEEFTRLHGDRMKQPSITRGV